MDIYLDKENMVMFIALKANVSAKDRENIIESYKKSGMPYYIMLVDDISSLKVI